MATTFPSLHARASASFHPTPSAEPTAATRVRASASIPAGADAIGYAVGVEGAVPRELGLDRAALKAAGFDGKLGQTLVVPRDDGPARVVVGLGERRDLSVATVRDAAAAFARAAKGAAHLAPVLRDAGHLRPDVVAQALAEGALLARYRYQAVRGKDRAEALLGALTVVTRPEWLEDVERGLERGRITARATELARDLGNSPAAVLTTRRLEEVARAVAKSSRLEVECFDGEALAKLGCGGLLGVNAGSAEPPRMIRLTYRPRNGRGRDNRPVGHVALVGKGIMYDSGGINLKPGDEMHAAMKLDMSGAGAILAAMSVLSELGCRTAVTGYLMCTENMPSGTALRMGDVLTIRGGRTIEVLNTDAEGRLVMADALVLATELRPRPDAIVDLATLTSACLRALGSGTAGLLGNHDDLLAQVEAAAARTDEPVWRLPLDRRHRKELDSEMAYMKNVTSGPNAGTITAALFLEEFVDGLPWAHLDILGPMKVDADESWRSKGATGYGARLLIELLTHFTPPSTP